MERYQYTIKKTVSCCGIGLHTGKPVNMVIKPAEANSGIRFVRTDLGRPISIPAFMSGVADTTLATTIANDDIAVSTTEHLLAALYGLGIDNAVVELDWSEVPIMDGSAGPFVHILKKSGRCRQKAKKWMIKITKEIAYNENGKSIRVLPHDSLKLTCKINFNHASIRQQSYSLTVSAKKFVNEVASARTFGFLNEVEKLRENGLALGGSLDNAVVMDQFGVLNEDGLRFADEFARHKVLDLLGDLALLGFPLLGHVIANKSGHGQHLGLMQKIAAHPECWEYVELGKDGESRVLNQVAATTKAAGDKILPYLVPPSVAFAGESCSV